MLRSHSFYTIPSSLSSVSAYFSPSTLLFSRSFCSSSSSSNTKNIKKTLLELDGETLSCAHLVSAGNNQDNTFVISVKPSRYPKLKACRDLVDKWANEERVIYGINTSCGGLVDHVLPRECDHEFQQNLIRCVATSCGELLPDEYVRMTMIARVNSLCRGYSGIKIENLEILLQMINKGVYPVVPEKSGLGASGDLLPLACIALACTGEWKCRYGNVVMPSKEALQKAGISPIYLNAKEGLALINGTSLMVSLSAQCVHYGKNLVLNHDIIAALSLQVLLARKDAFHPMAHTKKYHPGQFATAYNMTKLFEGSNMVIDDKKLSDKLHDEICQHHGVSVADIPIEDAYSIRCVPQFIGPIRDAISFAEDTTVRELNSTNDNPMIIPETKEFFHSGNFHGQYVSSAMDFVAMNACNVAVIADRRIDRMFAKSSSVGLPPFLAVGKEGINMGLMGNQFSSAWCVAENRTLLTPASCQSISTTDRFQDVVSFGAVSGYKCLKIIDNSEYALAWELISACQAADIRGAEKLSPASKVLFDSVREIIPFAKDNNILYMDEVEILKSKIRSGELVKKVTEVSGELMWIDKNHERAKLPDDSQWK